MGAPEDDPSSWSGAALGPTSSETSGTEIPSDFLREVARAPAVTPFSQSDLSGRTLGRYRVLSRLGRGAMGVVYAAEDQVLRRPVALKVLPPHLLGDPERRRRFLREARAAAAAAHPNIAAVYDVVDDGEQVFIAMERAQGKTLREALAGMPQGLPMLSVVGIGQKIASGLARAHEASVIHRDLKPDNVMLGPTGEVKILDFGVAKLREAAPSESHPSTLTEDGQLLGTPAYMAPEQAKGLAIDERVDLFSLGVILYEMATGVRPFSGKTSAEVIIAIDRDEPAPPSRRNPKVPAQLSRIIGRCLQKRAADRVSSAAELARDLLRLEASLEGRGEETKPARRRWMAGGVAAVASLSVAALLLGRFAAHKGASQGAATTANATASPLGGPGAALACPVFEASGVDEPSGWLGAAAASVACRRAQAILGGGAARVIVPAALLDLAGQPRDDFPKDPFGSPDARSRSLAAARARGAAYLTGNVERTPDAFRVSLVLKDAGGRELGQGSGSGVALPQAVRAAMEPFVRPDALPRAAAVDPDVARWSGIGDLGLLIDINDWAMASVAGTGVREEAARLASRQAEIGPRWQRLMVEAASVAGEGWQGIAAPPVDRSSPSAFARSAPVHALLDPHANAAALAEEASALAAVEPSAAGRAALAFAEAGLRNRAGDDARARALLGSVVQSDPTSDAWDTLVSVAHGEAGQHLLARAYAAWWPEASAAWNIVSISDDGKDMGPPIHAMHRAHLLSPGLPLFAVHQSMGFLSMGKRESARSFAAELLSAGAGRTPAGASDPRLFAGEYVLAAVEASEGRFGAALARARRVLASRPSFGSMIAADMYMVTLEMDLGMLLGRAPEVAEEFVTTFVDAEPTRLLPGRFVPGRVASVCALAPLEAARRCFDRLRSLTAAGHFREDPLPSDAAFIRGAEAYARRDYAAAAAAWRPIARMPATNMRNLLPDAFDRAGQAEIGERIDEHMLSSKGPFNGAGLAHLRQAKRLFARGERGRAEELGRRLIEAWSMVDVPVPAVAEMRALLAKRY